MFRDDFEFHEGAAPSHLGRGTQTRVLADSAEPEAAPAPSVTLSPASPTGAASPGSPQWAPEAERELGKIPFFVRGKARRNTERFASERGVAVITRDTLYEAKAHYGR
jgi:light-independent protochlorophyllide reductase subunit B